MSGRFTVREVQGHYLVSLPSTGALSLFTPGEYLVFRYVMQFPPDECASRIATAMAVYGKEHSGEFTRLFYEKLLSQGWLRTHREEPDTGILGTVYLTIARTCNLSCIYCYIGDERLDEGQFMTYEHAVIILGKIAEAHPGASLAITGGEPFLHPRIFDILGEADRLGFILTIGSNATLIDDAAAARLKDYKNLHHIQVSLDGMTPAVHAITRGDSWQETMRGIGCLIRHRVPFSLAPTLHEGNLHEVTGIARFAYRNGGSYTPNHLRHFPHAPYGNKLKLSAKSLRDSIIATSHIIRMEFPPEATGEKPREGADCSHFASTRCRYVCGNAYYTADIDWNGDVYPCHLLREPSFILGNMLREDVLTIMERGKNSPSRARSFDIPACRSCPFVATCAGGCRASAWYTHGTFLGEDEFCQALFQFETDKLLLSKGIL